MSEVAELTDHYREEPNCKIYTFNELGVPGLSVLGRDKSYIARAPSSNHYHRDRIEIKLLIKGYNVIFANEKEYHLKGGDVFIAPVNMPHNSGSFPKGIFEIYWFQLLIGKTPFLFLDEQWAAELQRQLGSLETGIIRGLDFSRKYLDGMFSLLCSDLPIEKYQGVSILLNLLHEIIVTRTEIQDSPSADIERAIRFIQANIYNEIMLEDLAKESNLSLTGFKEKFQEQIGMPPRLYINAQKVEASKKLLAEGKTVTDTAFDMGFNSSTYFSTVFRRFTQISPSDFVRKDLK